MRLRSLQIKNFRCFKEISLDFKSLENLSPTPMVILIGENSSGKSAFLEALKILFLYSKGIVSSPDLGSTRGREYLWFGATPEAPIIFNAVIDLSDNDRYELQKAIRYSFVSKGDLSITLALEDKEGSIYGKWEKIEGDGLPPIHWIEKEGIGGIEFLKEGSQSQPTIEISGTRISAVSIAQNIEALISKKFKFIPVARERPFAERGFGEREVLLPPNTEEEIKKMGNVITPREQREWFRYRDDRRKVMGGFDVRAGEIIREKEIEGERVGIPFAFEGGGYQMYLHLLDEVERSKADIFAIEEPENHLHPRLVKRLMKDLRRLADQGKQFFIATHSPFVIRDLACNTWLFWQERGESKAKRILDKEDYIKSLLQIGVSPSDFLFSSAILLVEGDSDKIFLSEIARKLGKDFEKALVTLIPVGGASKEKAHCQFWEEVSKHAPFPKFALLDKNAEKEKEKLIQAGMKDENIKVLKKRRY